MVVGGGIIKQYTKGKINRKTINPTLIVLTFLFITFLLCSSAFAQSKLNVLTSFTHHSATSSVIIQNEYLKIEVGNNGQYRGWTSAGDAIFYPYGDYPWSSFMTIRVNGSTYDNAPWSSNLDNYLIHETVKKSPIETETKWYIPEEDLEITQNIILVGEQAKFILKLKNKGTVTKTVSVRYLWDTQIADNDGAPLREEGGDLHEFEIAFEPVTFSYWSAYARPQPGSLVIYATWDTIPDKIIFAHWPEAYYTLWDYSWNSSRRFYTPGYTTSPESDSCVLMYWKDIILSPGEERSIIVYYGTTVGGGVNVDVSTDKEYYTSTENIKLSVKVTDASGNSLYPLEKDNFKVFVDENEVNIEKFERISATDYRLEIKSPQSVGTHSITVRADTATGWGSGTVGIKVYKISKVSLSVGGNRLTQYKDSADTPVYYRGDSNVYPVFFVDVEVEGATLSDVKDYIQVFVNINDYAKVKNSIVKRASYGSVISKYKADWRNIPNSYPVGKYSVTAEVRDLNGNSLASSEKSYFYLVFKPPRGYEGFVTPLHSCEIHSKTGPCPNTENTAGFSKGTKFYNLHQFEKSNWKPVLDKITGCITVEEAVKKLLIFAHGIDDSYYGYWHSMMDERKAYSDPTHKHGNYIYGNQKCTKNYKAVDRWGKASAGTGVKDGPNAWWYDVNDFKNSNFNPEHKNIPHKRPTGVCADYAALLVSNLRSAGIPAREIGGFFVGGNGHAFAEAYYDGRWHHIDPDFDTSPYDNIDNPTMYARAGYWKVVYTKKESSTCSSPVEERTDTYNEIVKILSIDFDKTEYHYPDLMTIYVKVKALGLGSTSYSHLKIYDHPTVIRLGPTHLVDDISLNLNPWEELTITRTYQLPDYGPLNWFYEHAPGFDRYIRAQIEFCRGGACYTTFKLEKKIPGLCEAWSAHIRVDSTFIALNTTTSTSFHFNETTNESIETFDRPLNTSVIVEHKVKYYTNYTREIWYTFNPDNKTHNYSLMTPLLGIGNAVYIPGYGSITTNQSINTDVSYIVIYNTTTGTNGSVDIYAFSQNITLRNITIFNGLVKVVGTWNTSLAQESGISYLSYFSTRNGSGMNFDEIYRDFAKEIINNGDSLTQFFIEGEDRQISYYKIGDTAYINVKVTNNGKLSETRNLNLIITQLGPWNSEISIYNTTKTVTVPAGSTITVTFQYQIPVNTSVEWHGIRISDGTAKATTIFIVKAPFNVTFDIPSNVTQKEEFYVNVTITNELDVPLSEINVTIDLPNDFNTSESLTKFIGTLSPGESAKISWLVTATDFEYGYAPFDFYINSAEGIRYIASTYTNVLRLPELRIYPSAPSEVKVNVPFTLTVNVRNEGDLGINNVSIHISLPNNVTASDSLTKSIGDLVAGEMKTASWTITSMHDSDFWINIEGWDESRTYYANATVFINIVKPKISINLTTPTEVIVNQSFFIIAEIKNIGEINATPVAVNLTLPSEFETTNDTLVIIENIAPGETKEVKWTVKGVKAGYGEITVKVNNASIRRGIVVSEFPLTVKTDKDIYLQGETVMITTNITNRNPEISYIDLRMNITIQGQGINETYSRPILYISSLETQEMSFSWDTTGKPIGKYTVIARLIEQSNSSVILSEASTSFEITIRGVTVSIETATGTGIAYFTSDTGIIENLVALTESDLPEENPHVNFPHGLFSFNITGLNPGEKVNITIALPDNVPANTEYWKYGATPDNPTPHWYRIPVLSNDGDNIIVIQLQDGRVGDGDLTTNGVITDPGGPGIPIKQPVKHAKVPVLSPYGLIAMATGLIIVAARSLRRN